MRKAKGKDRNSSWKKLAKLLVKACVCYFSFFHQMIPLNNYEKCSLFHVKSFFPFQDNQIFLFLSPTLFFPIGDCFIGWSKRNLQVYEVINCLNKNLIIHFVWYVEKEKRYEHFLLCQLTIDIILNKEHLYGKLMQRISTKN